MANVDSLGDVRYEHHMTHRGRDNQHMVQLFWIGICSITAVCATGRIFVWWGRRCNHKQTARPGSTRLRVQLVRLVALVNAISLLSIHLPRGLSSISVGRVITILAYTSVIAALLISVDAPGFSTHFIDDVAFRAAWVTVAQVPLVYFLSTKRGPLNFLAGISYERINWLHRWTGFILFLCATTHMAIMICSVSIMELMESPDDAMLIVRYGAAAYGALTWIALSSVLPLRRWSYRLFYLNHWACTLTFLWLIASHVPSYARLPIHASIALVATDKCLCAFRFLSINIAVRPLKTKLSRFRKGSSPQALGMGHPVKMMTPFITNSSVSSEESTTIIRISDVPFPWKPGQHVRLYLPQLGLVGMHPFTPATCSDVLSSPFPPVKDNDAEHYGLLPHNTVPSANDMVLMIKAQSGLTKRLSQYHSQWLALPCPNSSRPSSTLTAYIDGPYGNPPAWEEYENIVLIATSTGVTFLLSILDYLEQLCFDGQERLRTQQITFVWANRHIEPQFEATVMDMLSRHTTILRESDVTVRAEFYATCERSKDLHSDAEMREHDPFAHLRRPRSNYFARRPPLRIRNPNALDEEGEEEEWYETAEEEHTLKQIYPRASEIHSRSSSGTYVSSTLIDGSSDGSDLESMLEELEGSCWSRIPSLQTSRPYQALEVRKVCECANLRNEQKRSKQKQLPGYILQFYGQRPQIASVLSRSISRKSTARTMVAVCSNPNVVTEVKCVVSKMSMDFTRGRTESRVTLYTEGFE